MGVNAVGTGIPVTAGSFDGGGDSRIKALEQKLQQLNQEKKEAVQNKDEEKVKKLEEQIEQVKRQIEQLKRKQKKKAEETAPDEAGSPGREVSDPFAENRISLLA